MVSYRVGWWGRKVWARWGLPLQILLTVRHDPAANVFVATSDDFFPEIGFACEAPTLDDLQAEARDMLRLVLAFVFDQKTTTSVDAYMPQMVWTFA